MLNVNRIINSDMYGITEIRIAENMSYNYNNGEVQLLDMTGISKNCHYCHCFDIYNSLIKITLHPFYRVGN